MPTLGFPATVTIPALGILEVSPYRREKLLIKNWGGRTRTCNFRINSPAVCQLTYTPLGNLSHKIQDLLHKRSLAENEIRPSPWPPCELFDLRPFLVSSLLLTTGQS